MNYLLLGFPILLEAFGAQFKVSAFSLGMAAVCLLCIVF